MSMTTKIKQEKCDLIPAVCHIDNTARLQTVNKLNNSLYHRLISKFYKLTGIPMILNTSFNLKNSPIVETPDDAIKSFISSKNLISTLYMGNFEINLRPFPFTKLENIENKNSENDKNIVKGAVQNMLENELNIIVRAEKIYMCEMISTMRTAGGENTPLRIRIQGKINFLSMFLSFSFSFSFSFVLNNIIHLHSLTL